MGANTGPTKKNCRRKGKHTNLKGLKPMAHTFSLSVVLLSDPQLYTNREIHIPPFPSHIIMPSLCAGQQFVIISGDPPKFSLSPFHLLGHTSLLCIDMGHGLVRSIICMKSICNIILAYVKCQTESTKINSQSVVILKDQFS